MRLGRQNGIDSLSIFCLHTVIPHIRTPFQIISGRPLRGPLGQGIKCGGMDKPIGREIEDVMEIVCEQETEAKRKMKAQYDKQAKVREFEVGSLVLIRTPDLASKLDDIWEGPYEIIRKISSVTYELAEPCRRTKSMVAHVNMLKAWHTPEAQVLQVVVAQ